MYTSSIPENKKQNNRCIILALAHLIQAQAERCAFGEDPALDRLIFEGLRWGWVPAAIHPHITRSNRTLQALPDI